VLFVDHTAALGGAELYLLDYLRHRDGQHEVVLFEEGPFVDRLASAQVLTRCLSGASAVLSFSRASGGMAALRAIPGALRLIYQVAQAARPHDVVFANSQKAFLIAALAGSLTRTPVVWNLHDLLTADHFSSFNTRLVVAMANRCATTVVVNSEATRQSFVDAGGRRSLTRVVYNGLDVRAFAEAGPSTVREAENIGDAPLLGIFSRLAPWKGQHVLLEALATLPSVHALLVGEALFGDEVTYAQGLREEAERRGMSDRVHFLGFRDDIPSLVNAVDVVVHTSTAPEPFGRVIAEGLLAHKPVIATEAGGAREIVRAGETGWLVPPAGADALARAIGHVLADLETAQRRARAGWHDARERFSLDTMVVALDVVIQRAARSGA
jgi:glycosyltransferase involved in cell wall biosynthesis